MTLIGYWPLNENSGEALDHSGNENHGSLNGGVTQGTKGLLGENSYSFDGTDGYVSVADNAALNLSGEASVSAWVKIRSKPDNHPRVVQKEPTNDAYILWNSDDDGHVDEYGWRIEVGDADYYDVYTNGITFSGDWEHVVGTYDGSMLKIYYNGDLVSSRSVTGDINSTSGPLTIGGDTDNGSELDGKISEVRMYNRALTRREVQYLYSVGSRGLQTTSRKTS